MKRILLISFFLLFFVPIPVLAENDLQQLIDNTDVNGILELENKTYEGNIVITKPITIKGQKGTVIRGDETGNVIEIHASNVHVLNLTVTNSSMDRNSGEEYAAIKIFENNNHVENVTIKNSFHGIYLSQSHGNTIIANNVTGLQNGEIAGQGNGLHLYYSNDNTLSQNTIIGTRDGMFFDYSNHNNMENNDISHTRYGLHFMYSNENEFTNNQFSYNIAGAAIMFSYENKLSYNEFSLNQGSRSFGLLLQASDDNIVEHNLFLQNLRGIYLDQSNDNRIAHNRLIQNQIGVEIWSSSAGQTFTENEFQKNVTNILSAGGHSQNNWSENGKGNYWGANHPILDLDQDGIGDNPHEESSALVHLVEEQELTSLFLKSPAISMYEKINSITHQDKVMFQDDYPLTSGNSRGNQPFYIVIIIAMAVIFVVSFAFKDRRRAVS